jgi:prepilin-type processing-associated H-X9-DG protein
MHHDTIPGGYFNQYIPAQIYAYQAQMPNTTGPNADVLLECAPDMLKDAQLQRMPCLHWGFPLGLTGYISSAPRSSHPGGVNAAYLDGHVDFLRDDIDPFSLAYLIDIRDGQVPSYGG